MLDRKAYPDLLKAMSVKQIIAITGMRRVGKTTAVKYLLDRVNNSNKFYFDLERVENRMIFRQENYNNVVKSLEFEGVDFSRKTWIALDEIHLVPNISSVIKFLYDTYDIKFIVTGSSSYYLKDHFAESLAGRKRIYELFPLSFQEYLVFREYASSRLVEEPFIPYSFQISGKLMNYYKDYLTFGGFPEVVMSFNNEDRKYILKDIINSYLNLDIKFLADFSKVDDIYKVIRLLTSRVGSKTDFSKLSSLTGINRHLLKDYLLYFEQTYLIKQVSAYVTNPDREIALQKKLYFSDNGILNTLGNPGSGAILENSIAIQLSLRGDVKYYARRTGQEIDFILNEDTALEVKETPAPHDLKTLIYRGSQIGLKNFYLVGLSQPNPAFSDFVWAGNV
ncbi:MAG: ATP-binding protein [Bacteroidales bacterium]